MLEQAPPQFREDQPTLRYRLVGTRSQAAQFDLDKNVNFAAALFRMQYARNPAEMDSIVAKFTVWLAQGDYPGLEADLSGFASWRLNAQSRRRKVRECKTLVEVRMEIEEEQTWVQTARQEGKLEGRVEGERGGERKIVQLILEKHYGPLPDWAIAKLECASEEDLLRWAMRQPGHAVPPGKIPLEDHLDEQPHAAP
jgi:hypothetical protein